MINRWTGSKQLNAKGLTRLRQEIPRRVIWAGNQNSASYADQSKLRMSSAGCDVVERSEPTRCDRGCSILWLDERLCLLWTFLETDPGRHSRSFWESVPRSGPEQSLCLPTGPSTGEKVARTMTHLRLRAHHSSNQWLNRRALWRTHAAILSGGACPRWWTYTVRNSAPHRGQRLPSQSGNIRSSSSWA